MLLKGPILRATFGPLKRDSIFYVLAGGGGTVGTLQFNDAHNSGYVALLFRDL